MSDGRTVLLRANGELSILAVDGSEKRLASVPLAFDLVEQRLTPRASDAADGDGTFRVYLTDQDAFWVEERTGTACLWLHDRNRNMADVAVDVAVGVESGVVQWQAEWMGETATHSAGWSSRVCSAKARPRLQPTRWTATAALPFAFREPTGMFARAGEETADRIRLGVRRDRFEPASVRAASPSSRWLIVAFLAAEGDYVYWAHLALDRASGDVLGFDTAGESEQVIGVHRFTAEERAALASVTADRFGNATIPFARTMIGEEPARFLTETVVQLGNAIVGLPDGPAFNADGEAVPLSADPRTVP